MTTEVCLDERDFFSSLRLGAISLNEVTRGLEGNRGTGETGGESKCWDFAKPPPRVE